MIRLRQLLHMLRLYTGGALGVLNLCKQIMIMRKQFHNVVNLDLHVDNVPVSNTPPLTIPPRAIQEN